MAWYNSSIKVQNGNKSILSGETSTTETITEVDTSKAFIIVSVAGKSADYERHNITAKFIDSTTITFERNESGTEVFFTWQVIETDGGHFEVQTGEISVGSGDTTVNETISNVVDTSQCSIFYQFRGGLGDNSTQSLFIGELTSTTNLRFTRKTSGSTGTIRYWVIKWHEDVTVQNGVINMTLNTASDSITTVDLSKTAIFTTINADTNGLAQVSPVVYLGSTTSVNAFRETSTGLCDIAYSVVEFPSDVNVIANNEGNGGLTLDTTNYTLNETISAIDIDATLLVHTNACTGTGTAFCRTLVSSEFTSTTNIQFRCDYNGQNRDISYYAIDFSSWIIGPISTYTSPFPSFRR